MSADVQSMFYTGRVPWHEFGKSVLTELNSEQAIVAAGLDWNVEVAPIETADQERTAVDDYRVTRRVEDQAILGVVKKNFVPIQNRQAFKFFDSVVGEGKAVYHTAGALQGGSKVWVLAKMPDVLEIGKGIGKIDEVERYLLLSNAHDGSRPLQMLFTPVRVVCSNTLNLALTSREGAEDLRLAPRVAIKHTIDAKKLMAESAKAMRQAYHYYERFGSFANFLYEKQLDSADVKEVVARVFPPNKKKEVTPAIAHHRSEVERLFVEGVGHKDIAGSAWAMLNGLTQYADHGLANKKKTVAERSYSIWLGGVRGFKTRAADAVFRVAHAA